MLNIFVKIYVDKYVIKSSIKRTQNSELRKLFYILCKLKNTFTFFVEGAHIHCLPSLHLFQHGWRSTGKATSDSWQTASLQTQPAWTATTLLCVLILQLRLLQCCRVLFLRWGFYLCWFSHKYMVTLCTNRQRIFHRRLSNIIQKYQYTRGDWQSFIIWCPSNSCCQ